LYLRAVLWFDGSKVLKVGGFCKVLRISVLVLFYGFWVLGVLPFWVLQVSLSPVLCFRGGLVVLGFYGFTFFFCFVRVATFVF